MWLIDRFGVVHRWKRGDLPGSDPVGLKVQAPDADDPEPFDSR